MSLNTAAILIGVVIKNHKRLLEHLGLGTVQKRGQISLRNATRTEFLETAVGQVNSGTLIVNQFLPYDCSFQPGESSYLDEQLAQVAPEAMVMAFYLDGHTGGTGFALFKDGHRIRRRAVYDGSTLQIDEGPLLSPEQRLSEDATEESRIFSLSTLVFSRPIDSILFSDEPTLSVYEEK